MIKTILIYLFFMVGMVVSVTFIVSGKSDTHNSSAGLFAGGCFGAIFIMAFLQIVYKSPTVDLAIIEFLKEIALTINEIRNLLCYSI